MNSVNEDNPFRASAARSSQPVGFGESTEVVAALRAARPWLLFLSIFTLILSAIVFLSGLAVLSMSKGSGGTDWLRAFACFLGAAVYAVPGVLLMQYAVRIKRLVEFPSNERLVEALKSQRNFWRIVAIVVGIVVMGYLAMIPLLWLSV